MKALCWVGTNHLNVERVPDPEILNSKDAIVRVVLSSVCGSDLHLIDGYVPTMREGDIIGHEFMGEVVEVGGGTLSIVGVYGGYIDKLPMGAAMNKALTFRMGQMHAQKYISRLLEHVQRGDVDPAYLLTHRWPLERGQEGYQMFKHKTDECMRVVFAP